MPPHPISRWFLALLSVFGLIVGTTAEAADGTSKPIPPPARRYSAAGTYDPVGDQVLVFGGIRGDGLETNELWGHALSNGEPWTSKLDSGLGPHARSWTTLTYDSARGRMMLFGGEYYDPVSGNTVYLNDVWVASPSGLAWTQLTPSGTPPPVRSSHVAVYDSFGDRLIVVGGTNATVDLGDVWELKLSGAPAWNEIHVSQPLVRRAAGAVMDVAGSRIVLFGGTAGSTTYNDTWALSLSGPNKWTQLSPSGTPPSVREGHSAVFDPATRRMFVFGGASSSYGTKNNEAWMLSLAGTPQWTQLSPSGPLPPARSYHSAAWDALRGRMLVFGGYAAASPYYQNDLWSLDPSGAWNEIPAMLTPGGLQGSASFFDPLRGRLLVFGGTENNTYNNALWAHAPSSTAPWTPITANGTPPSPRAAGSFVYDAGHDRAILFGGFQGSTHMNDVWLLDLASDTWIPVFPVGTPPGGRDLHSAIYDAPRNRMIIFGGTNGTGLSAMNDTWELVFTDPPTWNQLTPSGGPPSGRFGQSAIFDPVRDRMVMWSGGRPTFDGGIYNTETWALSLSGPPVWVQLNPSGTLPRGRMGMSAFYDPVGDRMLTFGGGQAIPTFYGYMFNDTWELRLNGTPAWNELHLIGNLAEQVCLHAWGYDQSSGNLMVFGGFVLSSGPTLGTSVMHFTGVTTGVEPPSQSTALRVLASPNPFLTRTSIQFHLDTQAPVTLSVRDVQGRKVAVLVNRILDPGNHEYSWDPKTQSLGSGVYFYDLIAGRTRASGRLVLLK